MWPQQQTQGFSRLPGNILNYSDTYGSTPCSLVPLQSAAQPRRLTDCLFAASAAIYTPETNETQTQCNSDCIIPGSPMMTSTQIRLKVFQRYLKMQEDCSPGCGRKALDYQEMQFDGISDFLCVPWIVIGILVEVSC